MVRLKRVYEPASSDDGLRVLVDRLWPRGLTKERAAVDLWLGEVAPSTELRKWFDHDPEKWKEFQVRYRTELREQGSAVTQLVQYAEERTVTLVYAARDEEHNQAVVLKGIVDQRVQRAERRSGSRTPRSDARHPHPEQPHGGQRGRETLGEQP